MYDRLAGFVKLALAIAVCLLCGIPGQAVSISCLPPSVTLTISVTYSTPPPTWTVTVDPCNVSAFQLDLLFDSTRAQFLSGSDLAPFTQVSPPTLVSPGDLRFTGTTATPPPGEVNIFAALFQDLKPTQPVGPVVFTVLASDSDFVRGFDPASGITTTDGPANITPAAGSVPEPSTLLLFASGLVLGLLPKLHVKSYWHFK